MEHVNAIQQRVLNYHYIHPSHFKIQRNYVNTSICFSGVHVVYFPLHVVPLDYNLFRLLSRALRVILGNSGALPVEATKLSNNCTAMDSLCVFDLFYVSSETTVGCSFSAVCD